jgi:membrane associated rhomboid family serine protease
MFYFFYYFPLGIDLRPRRQVWATWLLIAACVAGYVISRRAPLFLWNHYESLVFVPALPTLSSLVLNAYLHGGWLHLISNMVSLIVFGPPLEERLGSRRFLVLYHVCNVFANIVQGALILLFMPEQSHSGVVGASGAIAGLLGLFLVRLYFARLRLGYWAFMPLQAYTRCGTAMIPVTVAIAMWFAMQLGMVLIQVQGAGAGVACGSHLGGLLGGFGLALLLKMREAAQAEEHLHRGRGYLGRALWFPAQGEFIEYVRALPEDEQGHLELARTHRITGRQPQADHHYRVACHLIARTKRLDRVEEIYDEAVRQSPTFALGETQQWQLAQLLERCLKRRQAERAYVNFANRYPESPATPTALFRRARFGTRAAPTRSAVAARPCRPAPGARASPAVTARRPLPTCRRVRPRPSAAAAPRPGRLITQAARWLRRGVAPGLPSVPMAFQDAGQSSSCHGSNISDPTRPTTTSSSSSPFSSGPAPSSPASPTPPCPPLEFPRPVRSPVDRLVAPGFIPTVSLRSGPCSGSHGPPRQPFQAPRRPLKDRYVRRRMDPALGKSREIGQRHPARRPPRSASQVDSSKTS